MRRPILRMVLLCFLTAASCVHRPVERARSAERSDGVILGETDALPGEEPLAVVFPPEDSPPPHHPRGGLLPFERRAGVSTYGVEGAVPGPPDLDFAPAPEADRVLVEVARAVRADAALRDGVRALDVDDDGGTLVVRGVVTSAAIHDAVLRFAYDAARGRMVKDELVVQPPAPKRP